MEALVHDLSHALDQSSTNGEQQQQQQLAKRRAKGWRRHSRSATSLAVDALTDESSSSVGDTQLSADRQLSSVQLSDSDDVLCSAGILCQSRRSPRYRVCSAAAAAAAATSCQQQVVGGGAEAAQLRSMAVLCGRTGAPVAESDSLNESHLPPGRLHKRNKRKLKRLSAQLGEASACMSPALAHIGVGSARRKRSRLQDTCRSVRQMDTMNGKRKCCQTGAGGGAFCHIAMATASSQSPPPPGSGSPLCYSGLDVTMTDSTSVWPSCLAKRNCDLMSSSSVSESGGESDGAGVATTDEARDGDDEQSDWRQPDDESQDELADRTAQLLRVRTDREVVAGKRRLAPSRAAPAASAADLTERVAQFVQDNVREKLQLFVSDSCVLQQLYQLARLYSLQITAVLPTVTLIKHRTLTCWSPSEAGTASTAAAAGGASTSHSPYPAHDPAVHKRYRQSEHAAASSSHTPPPASSSHTPLGVGWRPADAVESGSSNNNSVHHSQFRTPHLPLHHRRRHGSIGQQQQQHQQQQ